MKRGTGKKGRVRHLVDNFCSVGGEETRLSGKGSKFSLGPIFFRADEPLQGAIGEVKKNQLPGSILKVIRLLIRVGRARHANFRLMEVS